MLCTEFSSSFPFSVPAPCKMRWTWSLPAPQPHQAHLPFCPCFSSGAAVIGNVAPGGGFCQGTSLLLSLCDSHFSSVPTLPIFYTPRSSPAFLPCQCPLTSLHLLPPSLSAVGDYLLGQISLHVDIYLLSSF